MAQPLGRRHPNVVALKIDPQNILMRRRALDLDMRDFTRHIADQHLRLVRVQRRAVARGDSLPVIFRTSKTHRRRPSVNPRDASEYLEFAYRMALLAGQAILPHFREIIDVEDKRNALGYDPVTSRYRSTPRL